MADDDLAAHDDVSALVAVLRPMVKGHIRQTQNVLRFLAKLDELLDQTDGQGGAPDGTTQEAARVG